MPKQEDNYNTDCPSMPSPGSLLQLVATGKQDVYLTGNPQISFYKVVYRRYTPFSIESCRMYFEGSPNFGQRITCLVPRFGDLLGPLFLDVALPPLQRAVNGVCPSNPATDLTADVSYVNSIGHALIEEITIEIGEQEIDKQTGQFMEIWTQLTTPAGQQDALNSMIGRVNTYTAPLLIGSQRVLIPLQFWFCKNPGNYLPLLALQYSPVRINVKLRSLQELAYFGIVPSPANCNENVVCPANITSINLWGDYIALGAEERRRFVSNSHEYLIDQVQFTPKVAIPANNNSCNIKMDFNHPIKEIFWTVQRDEMINLREFFNFSSLSITDTSGAPRTDNMLDAKIQLDGQDRFEKRDATYFRLVQPYQRHTNTPLLSFIYLYSFALRPEDVQPTGSLNASRIDNFNLILTINSQACQDTPDDIPIPAKGNMNVVVYAINHNILKIVEGFGGLMFRV